jgi:hypothetical protein
MKNLSTAIIIVSFFISFAFMGCTTRVIDFTVLSTKNVDMSKSGDLVKGKRVKGKHSVPIIIAFPIGAPHMKTAVDRAIEKSENGVALLDGVLYYKQFYFPLIGGHMTYEIEGTLLELDQNKEK